MSSELSRETVVAQLRDALQAVLSVFDGAADGTILPEQVSEHLMLWDSTLETYRHHLPDQVQHVGRSVRAAVGEALGGVAQSSNDDRMIGCPLAENDEHWNETGRRYLLYCLQWLDDWSVARRFTLRRPMRLLPFDPWLAAQKS